MAPAGAAANLRRVAQTAPPETRARPRERRSGSSLSAGYPATSRRRDSRTLTSRRAATTRAGSGCDGCRRRAPFRLDARSGPTTTKVTTCANARRGSDSAGRRGAAPRRRGVVAPRPRGMPIEELLAAPGCGTISSAACSPPACCRAAASVAGIDEWLGRPRSRCSCTMSTATATITGSRTFRSSARTAIARRAAGEGGTGSAEARLARPWQARCAA